MKRIGVILVTYDGIVSSYCGIGTSCRTLINAFPLLKKHLSGTGIDLNLHLVTPILDQNALGYDLRVVNESIKTVSNNNMHFIINGSDGSYAYGDIKNWEISSSVAAQKVFDITRQRKYDEVIALFVDTPYAKAPEIINLQKKPYGINNVISVLLFESDVLIHEPVRPNPHRLAWEARALKLASLDASTYVADVGEFLTNHFKKNYGMSNNNFVPLKMGLNPEDNRFRLLRKSTIEKKLKKYGIPLNKDIIFSVGRAVDYKGFDILINAFSQIKSDAHLVFVASPYKVEESCVKELKKLIDKKKISCTPIFDCDFELPAIICQWYKTKVVAQLARYEPFGLVPEEVRLWSRNSGPVVLASNRDGFCEQISDTKDGFLVDIDDTKIVAQKIDSILNMDDKQISKIKNKGLQRFKNNYDYRVSLFDFFCSIISETQTSNRESFIQSLKY
jgi:glycosyltransferase involved in cell wall biosynthesis